MSATKTFISEKSAEILFNRFMLQWLGLGGAQLFAPTTREEYDRGYDGKVVGFGSMRELYLQFKAPSLSERDQRFTVTLDSRQHGRLLTYPKRAAYYVAGMFSSLEDFNRAQADVKTAEDFLRHFVCIDATSLPQGARRITFSVPESHGHSPTPGYKTGDHGRSPADYVPLVRDDWERGNTLVEKLKKGKLGRVVTFGHQSKRGIADATESFSVEPPVTDADCTAMGTFVRMPIAS